MKSLNIVGIRYQRLLVLQRVKNNKHNDSRWLCMCDCGKKTITEGYKLRNGHTGSCGCLMRDRLSKSRKKHGMRQTPIYSRWTDMKNRCYNKNNKRYSDWGGRGITVCDRWLHSFENFYKDMGDIPDGKTLDRINNDGNYEPGNCRWATMKEQNNNKRNTVKKGFL